MWNIQNKKNKSLNKIPINIIGEDETDENKVLIEINIKSEILKEKSIYIVSINLLEKVNENLRYNLLNHKIKLFVTI